MSLEKLERQDAARYNTIHRCAERFCVYYAKPSTFSCTCHKSREAMALKVAGELAEALDWLLASIDADPSAERHPDDKAERLLLAKAAARLALARATDQAAPGDIDDLLAQAKIANLP